MQKAIIVFSHSDYYYFRDVQPVIVFDISNSKQQL